MVSVANIENRVIVAMPTGRDAELVCAMLHRVGIECDTVAPEEIAAKINETTGVVLIAEEALHEDVLTNLEEVVRKQPIWSDLPIIAFSSSAYGAERLLQALSGKFNATIVERPIRMTILVSAVRGALRARQRQYEARDLLAQLRQADQQKDLFLATLSHELRTPLNSILGWIHILRRRNIGGSEMEHALDVIDRNARAQSEMIADILLVSRVITGKVELAIEPVEITSILSSSIDVIRPSAEAKNIQVSLRGIENSQSSMEGDRERLQQVFLNLLTNAVKFTPPNGHIEISLRNAGSDLEIEFKDDGIGIEPRFLPFIFERFRQADSKHTRRAGGLGLGLAIVSHLVEMHGGKVSAHSEGKNKGTSFIVKLPISETTAESPVAFAAIDVGQNGHSDSPLKGVRILIVEDDEDSREMLATILQYHGAQVSTAENVPDGFEKFQSIRPDILVSDVGLPENDGYDLIRRIRSLDDNRGGKTPAVALTGYASINDQLQALGAGYQEHLAKPIDTEKLINTIIALAKNADTPKSVVTSNS